MSSETMMTTLARVVRCDDLRATGKDPYAFNRPEELDGRVLPALVSRGWVRVETYARRPS